MDQLLTKIKDAQPLYQTAESQVQAARQVAYERLQTLHQAEHELLVALISQRQLLEDRMTQMQTEISGLRKLATVTEEVERPDNVKTEFDIPSKQDGRVEVCD